MGVGLYSWPRTEEQMGVKKSPTSPRPDQGLDREEGTAGWCLLRVAPLIQVRPWASEAYHHQANCQGPSPHRAVSAAFFRTRERGGPRRQFGGADGSGGPCHLCNRT